MGFDLSAIRQQSLNSEFLEQVRAFADWPGTVAKLKLVSPDGSSSEESVKIVRTAIVKCSKSMQGVSIEEKKLLISCTGSSDNCLQILELQPPNKKIMDVASFINGLNGRTVELA